MDLSKSQLSKFVSQSQVKPVTKAFHGKFLYRVECRVEGVWLLRHIKKYWTQEELAMYVKMRLKDAKKQGSKALTWTRSQISVFKNLSVDVVWDCYEITKIHKTRLEYSHFSIYFETEQEVVDLLTEYPLLVRNIEHLFAPTSDDAADQLKDDVVLMLNPTHKFKVIIREGQYDVDTKAQLLTYLQNFPDEFRIPGGLKSNLSNPFNTYLNGYYFANDMAMLTFVKLISPNFVRKIYRVEQL